MSNTTLYERLGGYDAIAAVSNDLVDRLEADPQLGRFWQHRGEDGLKRERANSSSIFSAPRPAARCITGAAT